MVKRYQSNQIKSVFLQTFRQTMCHRQCFLGEKYKQKELIHDTVTKSQNI